jgi:SAM-dependent methyltransferase
MLLTNVIKSIIRRTGPAPIVAEDASIKKVLNVGGGNKHIAIPAHYKEWRHLLLDIDDGPDVDIALDARELASTIPESFDAIYCSHNLEHYYKHDVVKVLTGFLHVLKPNGFAEILVPDVRAVMTQFVNSGMEIDDELYRSTSGPISIHDVVYGWGKQIESSGVDFYAHKTGFTAKSLLNTLTGAGFKFVWIAEHAGRYEVSALAFKENPSPAQCSLLGLPSE